MKFNYEQMRNKFNIKYGIDILKGDFIQEVFESAAPFELFDTPESCAIMNYDIEVKHAEKIKSDLNEKLISLLKRSFFFKIINPIKYIKQKNNFLRLIDVENKKITSKYNKLINFKILPIDKNDVFFVEHPDINISDNLFLVSLNKEDFGIHLLKVDEIRYYQFNGNEFRISIFAKRQSDGKSEAIFSLNEKELTNRFYNNFIFKENIEANKFFKKYISEEEKFLSIHSK